MNEKPSSTEFVGLMAMSMACMSAFKPCLDRFGWWAIILPLIAGTCLSMVHSRYIK